MTATSPPPAERRVADRRARASLVAVLAAMFAAMLLYKILNAGGLEQTALFYVGIPATLALTVALFARPQRVVGLTMAGITIGLALAGPLLNEGVVCLVVAAPLFYGVGALVAGLVALARPDGGHRSAMLVLPLLMLAGIEGLSPAADGPGLTTVSAVSVISAHPDQVEQAIAATPVFGRPASVALQAGFPLPVTATGAGLEPGDERAITFTRRRPLGIGADAPPREMGLIVTEAEPGRVVFDVVSDSTLARWLDLDRAEVTWRPVASGTGAVATEVTWTMHYRRTYDPAWYFGPVQRQVVGEAAEYLLNTVATPRQAVAGQAAR